MPIGYQVVLEINAGSSENDCAPAKTARKARGPSHPAPHRKESPHPRNPHQGSGTRTRLKKISVHW